MSKNTNDTQKLERLVEAKENFFSEIGKIVIGQKEILDFMLIALLTKGAYATCWSSWVSKNTFNKINGRNL